MYAEAQKRIQNNQKKPTPGKKFSTFKVMPNTAMHPKREKFDDEFDNPLDSARASQIAKPAPEIGLNFMNGVRGAATEGKPKRKTLFPQERKVSVNPTATTSPLLGGGEGAQKFSVKKKYGATPDMAFKTQRSISPSNEKILI